MTRFFFVFVLVGCVSETEIGGSAPALDGDTQTLEPGSGTTGTTEPGQTSTTGGSTTPDEPTLGRGSDELPPEFVDDDCANGVLATWIGGEIAAMSWEPAVYATLVVPELGVYDVYDLALAESGASQTNESAFLRISSVANPTGLPEVGNCGDDYVVLDSDNMGPPPGTTQYLGTFLLDAGDNLVEANHYCGLARAGDCLSFHDSLGTPCDGPGVNSVHLTGAAVCLVPVL